MTEHAREVGGTALYMHRYLEKEFCDNGLGRGVVLMGLFPGRAARTIRAALAGGSPCDARKPRDGALQLVAAPSRAAPKIWLAGPGRPRLSACWWLVRLALKGHDEAIDSGLAWLSRAHQRDPPWPSGGRLSRPETPLVGAFVLGRALCQQSHQKRPVPQAFLAHQRNLSWTQTLIEATGRVKCLDCQRVQVKPLEGQEIAMVHFPACLLEKRRLAQGSWMLQARPLWRA